MTYAHLAAHPQEQVGQLTAALPLVGGSTPLRENRTSPQHELTTVVTTTQTTTEHQLHHAKHGCGADRSSKEDLASVTTQSAGLPPGDRSCDRNEQDRAALGHRPANGPVGQLAEANSRRVRVPKGA